MLRHRKTHFQQAIGLSFNLDKSTAKAPIYHKFKEFTKDWSIKMIELINNCLYDFTV